MAMDPKAKSEAIWMTILIVVIMVVGIAVVNNFSKGDSRGTIARARQAIAPSGQQPVGAAAGDIGAFNSALALYQVDVTCHQFPQMLYQLEYDNAAGWAGPYMAAIAIDPWGNAYTYTGSAANYTVLSVHQPWSANEPSTIRYIFADGTMQMLP